MRRRPTFGFLAVPTPPIAFGRQDTERTRGRPSRPSRSSDRPSATILLTLPRRSVILALSPTRPCRRSPHPSLATVCLVEGPKAAGEGPQGHLRGVLGRGGRRGAGPFEAGHWGQQYAAVVRSWRSRWEEVFPFLAFSPQVRKSCTPRMLLRVYTAKSARRSGTRVISRAPRRPRSSSTWLEEHHREVAETPERMACCKAPVRGSIRAGGFR